MWQTEKTQCFKEITDILKGMKVLFLVIWGNVNDLDLNFPDNNVFTLVFSLYFLTKQKYISRRQV